MTTRQRQNLLQYLGYYSGIPDGEYGPLTRKAVERFQEDFGGIPVFDWGENDFAFHVPVYMGGNLLASKRNVSASAYAEMAKGAVHNLKESIILKHPVFATLAFQAAVGRASGSSGNKEITFANITSNGKLIGLPSGLTAVDLLVTIGI